MILECEYCYSRMVIKPDERETRINFCPHCGEATEDDLDEIYVGVYSDWDIGDENSNVTGFDVGKDIGYAMNQEGYMAELKC